jgi:hypothetical protein
MRSDPPEQAVLAMAVLTMFAIGFVWVIETVSKLFR